ncbi:MAG TPA: twin-arginine translocation signal domain-containing protein [bacterium]|nr:twin-arginine translocation signal domain-containing protein [bacterium]HPM60679.1 twin-arginine translocation signal domain-containing protein [bacterium]
MISRRNFLKSGSAAALLTGAGVPAVRAAMPPHLWNGSDLGTGPFVKDRLDQGPFTIEQDQGWRNIGSTTASDKPVRNFGLGLTAYTWEEGGPAIPVRQGKIPLEKAVETLASLPFVDVLYIRCDWRDVQSAPGRLNLNPVWKLTFEAAKQYNLRVGFRVQLSSPNFQPRQLALPDFLLDKVPLVKIGKRRGETNETKTGDWDYVEPRYDHPAFKSAFRELNDLLAAEYNDHPLVEFMDMMMYGFWGEGHTNNLPNPFPDYLTAEKTMLEMTRYQIDTWTRVPLAINTQPDISSTGNYACLDMAVRAGCWLRSDSILFIEEPIQIEHLSSRPPWLAAVMEQGRFREYDINDIPLDEAGINLKEKSMLHCVDMGANYWALWTEGENLRTYYEKYPAGFDTLQRRLGYRVRPSWIWQRKRYGTSEVILAIANDGVAGVPGILRVYIESEDGRFSMGGGLDAGHPHGGRLRQCNFILPPGMEGKKMKLRAEIETKGVRRPVQWACAQPLNPDGSFPIQLNTFDDPGWRKGI